MKAFKFVDAHTYEEAAEILAKAPKTKAAVMAGGTDIVNVFKHAILDEYPEQVVNLKTIKDSEGISEEDGCITIKAMTKLTDIEESELLLNKATALQQAAKSVAAPILRNMGTIGGNICQDVRCWYYRYPHEVGGRMDCSRKGGGTCYAIQGDNRYHSVFGGMKTQAGECMKACPALTDISAYMAKIREGDWDAAARLIMRVNPMPMLTARICPHPCQDDCNQNAYGDCVSIHCVERTLGDYILQNADRFYLKPEKETGKKFGIVGAGPGGLTCAYYLRAKGHDVTVIDAHEKAGGVLQYGIPHYRLPRAYVDGFVKALETMGVKFELNKTVGKDVSMDEIENRFDSVYLGTGAWKQPILGIKGEELTHFGLNFLTEVNGFLKKTVGDAVLVCGGGNVAMDVALTAKRMGAKAVRLVCLEQEDEMPATAEEIARAKEEGVEIINGWGLKRVVTDASGKTTGLESMKCVSVFDERRRFAPVYDEDDTRVFESETIILATGQRVDLSFLGDDFLSQLSTTRGLVEADAETFQTKKEKIFAGGDAVTGPDIAIRAINAGGRAARAMSARLGFPFVAESEKDDGFIKFDVKGIEVKNGATLEELPVEQRTLTDEDAKTLDMAQAEAEARRCMNCGCYSINASDISPVLVAFDGAVVTTKKTIAAADFFTTKLKAYDMLDKDELVTAIQVPDMSGYVSGYEKVRIRKSIDFALASFAYAYKLSSGKFEDVRLVLSGVAPVPIRLNAVEALLKGKAPSAELAKEAAELAVKDAMPMSKNNYKVSQSKVFIERFVAGIK